MMKKFEIENVLNQKRAITHISIFLFSILAMIISMAIRTDIKTPDAFISGLILIFVQIEAFLLIAHLIFSKFYTGSSPGEITRIMLVRFTIFIAACMVAAFMIFLSYLYIRQLMTGGDLEEVMGNFFRYSFIGWFKSTLGGLSFGGIIFIVILWQDALRREQRLREENLVFQNETLRSQVNPHFLFNSLNTLSSLMDTQPDTTKLFISKLSSIYRYILDNSHKDKVTLKSELAFVSDYFDLHKIRDEEKIVLTTDVPDGEQFLILPVSLQILLENAIKHNMATRDKPLRISISVEDGFVVVRNNLRKMASQPKSTKTGLKNLAERVRLVTGKTLIIEETANDFTVKVPLIS